MSFAADIYSVGYILFKEMLVCEFSLEQNFGKYSKSGNDLTMCEDFARLRPISDFCSSKIFVARLRPESFSFRKKH